MSDLMDHKCTLPKEERITVRYIDSGCFVYLRRQFRELLMVSRAHPGSFQCFKSHWTIRHEEERHLQNYYYVVHPFSVGRMYWQFLMVLVFAGSLLTLPFHFAAEELEWDALKLIFDIMCCCDIVVTLFTGYYNRNNKQVVLGHKEIIFQYVTSYFLPDLVSSLPIYFLATHVFGYTEEYTILKQIELFKIFRIITLLKYLNVYRDYKKYSMHRFKIFKMAIFFTILLLWASSLIYIIARHTPQSWMVVEDFHSRPLVDGILRACFKTIYMLLLVGHSDEPSSSVHYKAIQSMTIQIGFILKLFMFTQVAQILMKYKNSSDKYQQRMDQINEYARYKGLPEWMKRKICRYFEFKYQKHFVKENEIISVLPPFCDRK